MFDRFEGGNEDNVFIDQWLADGVPAEGTSAGSFPLSIMDFIESLDTSGFWSFDGSLTTPPCTEGIKWAVLKQVQPISDRQLKIMTDLWAGDSNFASGRGNNRVTQPLMSRTVFQAGAFEFAVSAAASMLALLAFV